VAAVKFVEDSRCNRLRVWGCGALGLGSRCGSAGLQVWELGVAVQF